MNDTAPVPYRDFSAPLPPAVERPRLWTLLLGIVVTVLVTVVGVIATLGVFGVVFTARLARSGHAPSPAEMGEMIGAFALTAPGILVSGLVTALAFGGVALFSGVLSAAGVSARLRLQATPRWFMTGLAAMLQLLGFGMVASQVAIALGMGETGTLPLLRRAFSHLTPPLFVLSVLIVGVGAGVAEELFFRGYLLTRLEQRVRPWFANMAVAFAFALAHFDPVHSSFAFLVGVAQGWTSRRSGSIRAAMVAHTFNNIIGVVSMAVAETGPEPLEVPALLGGVALVLVGTAGVWRLTRDAAAGQPPSNGGAP
jgi:membrane protease YdiL (CAAX protease family)